ncbi:ras-specific guanine nucleotide-releasing factor 2 [Grus japonensis]|uniref:Ras-specific guanine nucleotide-releasing factor 2 n=1 Tax=Grus japonensis TaxID=30415 RepID=A0ABC9Y8W2_GRUJA
MLSDARLHRDDIDICFSKTLNSCKVPQIRYASVERLLERLTDLRFLSIDFLNTFLHTYRIFTTATVVLEKLSDIYRRPFTSIPVRSLELFFSTGQNNKGEYQTDGKSPNLSRKFSSPPPLSLSRTSSPVRTRKLSLTSPLNSRIGALDLSSSSVASSPTSTYSPATSPPPTGSKVPLDLSKGLSSPEQSPGSIEDSLENPRVDLCNKLKRSIRKVQTGDNSYCSVSPASAFAIATAAAGHGSPPGFNNFERICDKEFIIRRAATNRVLNVLRHWVSKHSQDFDMNSELKGNVFNLLEEVLRDPDLLPQERKATANILRALSQDDQDDTHLKIEGIIQMSDCRKPECFETLSAMELAEQITLLDHIIFRRIPYDCNPPAVPYLGMYLTDLAFIEEGTPNFTEEGLVNFSKMRMISHIIREIRQFQQTSYRIEHQQKVTHYLLDKTLIIDEDTLYELSLKIEPRLPA